MSYGENTSRRIEAVRTATVALLKEIQAKVNECGLPEPSPLLEAYRRQLIANQYQVLVAGEAKRGKSSFINALIGRPLLPTDVDVATNQVFRIRRAVHEAYRLRFEDGSVQEVGEEELMRFGSQVFADSEGILSLSKMIRWIEVDIPARFLPKGLSILDTPGMGSLYSAHAQITQRFVPFADAVIFVLDSNQPVTQTELEFLDTILDKTSNIFFLQTKIDQQRRAQWQVLKQRNEAILEERFQNRLKDGRVWPISSANLLKAVRPGQDDDEDYLLASRYREMASVLQVFLFHVAGWDRIVAAIQEAENYAVNARTILRGRLAALAEASKQQRLELQQRIVQRKQQFESEWSSASGKKQKELLEMTNKVMAVGKRSFVKRLEQGNQIELEAQNTIDTLKSIEEAQKYNRELDGKIIGAFLDTWQEVCEDTQKQCNRLLAQFFAAADALSVAGELDSAQSIARHTQALQLKDNWSNIWKDAQREEQAVLGTLGFFLPSPLAHVAALCWVGIRALFIRNSTRLEDAKKQVRDHLDETLAAVRKSFLEVDLSIGYESRVDSFFTSLQSDLMAHIETLAHQKSAEAQAELNLLSAGAQLDEQARKDKIGSIQEQLSQWETISQSIREIVTDLKIVEHSLTSFSEM